MQPYKRPQMGYTGKYPHRIAAAGSVSMVDQTGKEDTALKRQIITGRTSCMYKRVNVWMDGYQCIG